MVEGISSAILVLLELLKCFLPKSFTNFLFLLLIISLIISDLMLILFLILFKLFACCYKYYLTVNYYYEVRIILYLYSFIHTYIYIYPLKFFWLNLQIINYDYN